MNNTKNKNKVNNKPRYYIRVALSNGKICFCKIMSYNKMKVDKGFRLPLDFVSKDNKFYNSSVDLTLFTKIDSKYVDDVDTYCDNLYFDDYSSCVIFNFLMSSEKNRKRFIEFCEDNKLNYIDFFVKMK